MQTKQRKQLLAMSDLHGQATPLVVCYCAGFFDFPRPRLIVVGDLCHRGPDPGLLLRLGADVVVLGDHDLNFLSAMGGSLKAIAYELRNGYRTNQQDFYKNLGINLEKFETFSQKNYPPQLITGLKKKLQRTVNNVEELAASIMWVKLSNDHELRIHDLGLTTRNQFFQEVEDICSKLAGFESSIIESSIIADPLNMDEKRILEDIRNQLIDNEKLRELAVQLLEKGRLIYKEDNMLFVHATIPISESRQFLDFQGQILTDDPWSYWQGVEENLIGKFRRIFEHICNAYQHNTKDDALTVAKNQLWDTCLPDQLFRLSDSEYSPAFARKQTRTIHTFFKDEDEPENTAQILIREKNDTDFIDALCDTFNVDVVIVGHISNEDGDIKAYRGNKRKGIISIDPFFAKKRGLLNTKGKTETGKGAGLLITGEGDQKTFEVIRILSGSDIEGNFKDIMAKYHLIADKSVLCERNILY